MNATAARAFCLLFCCWLAVTASTCAPSWPVAEVGGYDRRQGPLAHGSCPMGSCQERRG